jgi:hypothetical protein
MSVLNIPITGRREPSYHLEDILVEKVNISKALRSSVSDSQKSLREFLASETQRDSSFPRVLSSADADFIGGSFGRHTKIKPLDDIDVYVPLDGAGLFYFRDGAIEDCTVLSDNTPYWSPLLTSRWAIGGYVSSSLLLEGFGSVLRRRYSTTNTIRKAEQAIKVQLTLGSSAIAPGLGYDIVPCFSLDYPNSTERRVYLIPDGNNGWIRTNPRTDLAITEHLSSKTDKSFRKAVKLMKLWNTDSFGKALGSYYIELALQKAVWDHVIAGKAFEPLSFAVAFSFWALNQAVQSGDLTPWTSGAPAVKAGQLTKPGTDLLAAASDLACTAWKQEQQFQLREANSNWERLFPGQFGV